MGDRSNVMVRDNEILSGAPVFDGTRVPIRNLFDYLAAARSALEKAGVVSVTARHPGGSRSQGISRGLN